MSLDYSSCVSLQGAVWVVPFWGGRGCKWEPRAPEGPQKTEPRKNPVGSQCSNGMILGGLHS